MRVKFVRQSVKEDNNFIVFWAVGTYPVEREVSDLEMVLFIPIDSGERDPETQAVFEKDGFYSVGGKIIPGYYGNNKRPKMIVSISTNVTILNKVANANKCPLKVSLAGVLKSHQ